MRISINPTTILEYGVVADINRVDLSPIRAWIASLPNGMQACCAVMVIVFLNRNCLFHHKLNTERPYHQFVLAICYIDLLSWANLIKRLPWIRGTVCGQQQLPFIVLNRTTKLYPWLPLNVSTYLKKNSFIIDFILFFIKKYFDIKLVFDFTIVYFCYHIVK